MRKKLFWILLAVFILLQGTLISLPLVLDLLLILYIYKKSEWVLIVAFISGFLVDILTVRQLGSTALFYLISLILVFLYERKYEIQTKEFTFFFSFLAGLLYFKFFEGGFFFGAALLNAAFSVVLFLLMSYIRKVELR